MQRERVDAKWILLWLHGGYSNDQYISSSLIKTSIRLEQFLIIETVATNYLTVQRKPYSILRDFPLCLCDAQTVTAGSSSQEKEKDKTSDGDTNGPAGEPEKSHSNSSTLSDRRPSDSSLCSIEEEHRYVYDMVHAILLSTRDNVNFVNEVFHQVHLGHQMWYIACIL